MASTDLQLSGLASGFDWKSLVDSLMAVERAPVDRLESEKTKNGQKVAALNNLGAKLTALQTSANGLNAEGIFSARSATLSGTGSTWSASAGMNTNVGTYKIAVSQLATAARREGAANIGGALNATADVSGITIANLPIASAVTAGSFTVNGRQISVALTDSLETVLNAIGTATGNAVTAAYNPATDKIELSGTGEIVLGAANDTSNFLGALKLNNNGTSAVASSTQLGTLKTSATLANANLATPITAVDGAGAGTFQINGVSIAYNVNTDTLSGLLAKINQSTAGVTATYDAANDRVALTNKSTGDVGISLDEAAGGVLGALGITSGTLVRGKDAIFTLNDGGTLTSKSNTLDATAHGVTGFSVTVNSEGTQTVQVAANTSSMRSKIDDFISKFNDVQDYLDTITKITTSSAGKVTAAVLTDNREIQEWGRSLRNMAFSAVGGLSGTITRLESLGIDFTSGTSKLEVKDSTKLDTALREKSGEVEAFFRGASTGFAGRFNTFLTKITDSNSKQQANLNKSNTSMDAQIADLERRLAQQREVMTSAFIAMETAQSQLQTQQAALTKAFSSS